MMVIYDKWNQESGSYNAEFYQGLSIPEAEEKHDELVEKAGSNDIISIVKMIKETII